MYDIDIIRELGSGKIRKARLARSALTFAVSVANSILAWPCVQASGIYKCMKYRSVIGVCIYNASVETSLQVGNKADQREMFKKTQNQFIEGYGLMNASSLETWDQNGRTNLCLDLLTLFDSRRCLKQ